jgi:hypothetical protein
MTTNHIRGDFPAGPAGETPEQKRLRYEEWIIRTHDALPPLKPGHKRPADPEYDAVKAQADHWGKPTRTIKTFSKIKIIRARCWQCVGGADDHKASASIANCTAQTCALWSVRPFQDADSQIPHLPTPNVIKSGHHNLDHIGKALANPGNRSMAIKGYCHTCKGGGLDHKTQWAVWSCEAVDCAIWPVKAKRGT